MNPAKLPPTLAKAFGILFARQVKEEFENARGRVRAAEQAATHYAYYLAKTGNKAVWGDDARTSKRDVTIEKKNLAFWRKAAAELKGMK